MIDKCNSFFIYFFIRNGSAFEQNKKTKTDAWFWLLKLIAYVKLTCTPEKMVHPETCPLPGRPQGLKDRKLV